jgi:predicted metal-binding protein
VSTPSLLLCRGCCCGTTAKVPRLDHEAQEDALKGSGVEVRVVDCLDECDRANVAVLRRPGLPRRERDLWLGGLTTERATDALVAWLDEGATGTPPRELRGRVFRHVAPRR